MVTWARWLLLGLLLLGAPGASAETVDWINPAGGDFEDGDNWSTGQVPGPGDVARLALDSEYTVNISDDHQLHGLVISGPATLDLNGNEVRLGELFDGSGLTISGGATLLDGSLIMGWGDVTISGGPFHMHGATISDKGARGGQSSLTLLSGEAHLVNSSITTRTVRISGLFTLDNSGLGGETVWLQECDISGGWVGGGEITRVTGPARVRNGTVVNPFTGVLTVAGDLDVESGAMLRLVSRIEAGTTTVENASISAAIPSAGVVETGRLELLAGSECIGSLYLYDNGALRLGHGAGGPEVLEYYGAPGVRLEIEIDGLDPPAPPLLLAPWATELNGALRLEVLHPNVLRVGDEAGLLDAAGATLMGHFAVTEVPEIHGGREVGILVGAQTVSMTVTPGGIPCWSADFDGDGQAATDADIEAFFACIGGCCCPLCGLADFDSDGDAGTDADIETFFRILSGGPC